MENIPTSAGGNISSGRRRTKIILSVVIGLGVFIIIYAATVSMRRQTLGLSSDSLYGATGRSGGFSAPSLAMPASPKMALRENNGTLSETADASMPDKKVIKNGDLTLKVSKTETAAEEIGTIAKNNSGEVFSSNFYQSSNLVKSGTVVVKVPVNNFDKTFNEIKEIASLVVRESTSGQDVTEQYTDLQSRLKNKQAEEQSFVKILDRASSIEDILNVTRELSRVRGEIEMLQGQIQYFDSQTDMATISVTLSEDSEITISDSWRPLRVIKDTVNSLLKDVQKFVNFGIILIIRVIPIVILYLLLVFILFLIGRKIYRKIKAKKSQTPTVR